MANQKQLDLLKQGVEVWNQWRQENPNKHVDLNRVDLGTDWGDFRMADLSGVNIEGVNLTNADLSNANLREADLESVNLKGGNLSNADLQGANLQGVNLYQADLRGANLIGARLIGANFHQADLREANLSGTDLLMANLSYADLRNANLRLARLIFTNLSHADLSNCSIFGISAWHVQLDGAIQSNLSIDHGIAVPGYDLLGVSVDDLMVGQLVYLLLHNPNIREVIDTVGQKGVLILGRFSDDRKPVLDALRKKLLRMDFIPMIFDFPRPLRRDFTETIMTLAGLCRFIIADITNPKSSPLELQATVPNYMIPFVPIIQEGEEPFAMFQDLKGKYDWVLDTLVYDTPEHLIEGVERAIVKPALEKSTELMARKAQQLHTRHINDYL